MPDTGDELRDLRTVGRDDFLMEQLAKRLLDAVNVYYDYSDLRRAPSGRGYEFRVRVRVDGLLTGHIARVVVELEKLDG